MKINKAGKILLLSLGILGFLSCNEYVKAANVGDIVNFNVDKNFDASGRTQVPSTLVKISPKLYFYIEKNWWDSQTTEQQNSIFLKLDNLSEEFDSNIYPNLTSIFGLEWNPGIDKDSKISVLFESMNSTEGGYFREADEYEKIQIPNSNEREMVYLSVTNLDKENIRVVLAHEFLHLITFNQKNRMSGLEEETWLNEARADYVSTILGYDDNYSGSNLQQRVKDFIENPSDSITDWTGTKYDYASINLFTHYIVDHYGVNILSDSLKSKSIGIQSINDALLSKNTGTDFSKIFTNWIIALAINDCSKGVEYCYINESLKSLRINPALIFLPITGSSSLTSTNVTKNWAGYWHKVIGGSGDLKLSFSSLPNLKFKVPYIIFDKNNNYTIDFLKINSEGKASVDIQNFGIDYKSLVVALSLQNKMSDFDSLDFIYPYTFVVSISGKGSQAEQDLIQNLLAQIELIKAQIAKLQGGNISPSEGCKSLSNNLYIGLQNNADVRCLQEFLKNQGAEIYPEGLVTGNFGNLTKSAVIKFQIKYSISATGYVGSITRAKINQLNGL